MIKKILIGGILILLVLGIIFLGRDDSSTSNAYRLGGAFALSGFAGTWGEADRNGGLLAIEELQKQGVDIELIVEDTKSDNRGTLSAVKKLISIDKVDVIIGPTWMDSFTAAVPVSDQEDIIMIAPSAAITAMESDEDFQNVFSTWYRSDIEMKLLPEYLEGIGLERVAIIGPIDPFWEDAKENFRKGAGASSIQVVSEESVDSASKDLRTQLAKIKQVDPDVLLFGFSSEENYLSFLSQKELLSPETVLVTTEAVEEFVDNEKYRDFLDGIIFIAPHTDLTDFTAQYQERFEADPLFSASNSYDAVMIIGEALQNTDGSSEAIREYLHNNIFNTTTFGETRFDALGGVTGGSFVIKRIQNGSAVEIGVASEI